MDRRNSKTGAVRSADWQQPFPTSPAQAAGDAWSRAAVTFRLTDERKRALQVLLANANSSSLSPTSALDLAIELAASRQAPDASPERRGMLAGRGPAATQDELRDTLRALAGAASDWDGARTLLARVADDCAALRFAIAAAAAPGEDVGVEEPGKALPIRAWLDRAGAPTWLVARADWVGTRPAGPRMALWTLEMRELGRDGATPERPAAGAVVLGPSPAGGKLCQLERDGGCVMSCSRGAGGWTVSLRPALEGGKLGEPFAELRV